MSLSKQAAFVLKVFFAASLGTNCFANQAVDQSAAIEYNPSEKLVLDQTSKP